MWWRMSGPEYSQQVGRGTQTALKHLTAQYRHPGILAYADGRPVGWCSVAPRSEFLARLSRWTPFRRGGEALNGGGDGAIWSVVCFFVDRRWRGRGIAEALVREAVRYAAAHGASVVEAYPEDAGQRRISQASAYTGTLEMFRRAGFHEVVRAYPHRPIVRRRTRRS